MASWTDERVEVLKKLWNDGLSASQIAMELGGVTRNAVIGKVHRLGLSGRGKTSTTTRARTPRAASVPPRAKRVANGGVVGATALKVAPEASPEVVPLPKIEFEELVIPIHERKTIMELTESTCRWPIGDPLTGDFYYCGRNCGEDGPYCSHHAKIAYQPVTERKRRAG